MQCNRHKNKYLIYKNKPSLFTTPPTNQITHTHSTAHPVQPAVVDTGSTGIYLPTSFIQHIKNLTTDNSLSVRLPNNHIITSSHTGDIVIPTLPHYTFTVHIFPELEMPLLSVSDLTAQHLRVTFTHTQLIIADHSNTIILTIPRTSSLWTMPLTSNSASHLIQHTSPPNHPTQSINNVYFLPNGNKKALCLFWIRTFCHPSKSTFIRACNDHLLDAFIPFGLTAELLRKHWVLTPEEAYAHLDQTRKNLRSTKPSSSPPTPSSPQQERNMFTSIYQPTHTNASDGTGNFMHFPFYFLIMYNYDTNTIHSECAYNHTASEYVRAYNAGLQYYAQYNIKPNYEVMDNILAAEIAANFRDQHITVSLVPPGNHRALRAERIIRVWKNHTNGCLNATSSLFPLSKVRFLLPHIDKTLNLLRPSKTNPNISAWEGLNGKPYDYNAHPFHPAGTRCVVLDRPENRDTWANHGREYFNVNSADKHYRCTELINSSSTVVRVSDSIQFLPDATPVAKYPTLQRVIAAESVQEPSSVTTHGQNVNLIQPLAPNLEDLPQHTVRHPPTEQLFLRLKADHADDSDTPYWNDDSVPTTDIRQPTRAARFTGTYSAHVSETEGGIAPPIHSLPETITTPQPIITTPSSSSPPTIAAETEGGPQRPTETEGGCTQPKPSTSSIPSTYTSQPITNSPSLLKMLTALTTAAVIATATTNKLQSTAHRKLSSPPSPSTHDPNKPWDFSGKILSNSMSYKAATNSEFRTIAEDAFKDEMRRLLTRTKSIIRCNRLPQHKIAPRGNIIVKIKPPTADKPEVTCRVRLTADGSRSQFDGDRSSITAEIVAVKIFLNSVVSDDDTEMITADLQDAYLSEDLPPGESEYLSLLVSHFPLDCREEFGIANLSETTIIYYQILKGLYGMPQAGLLYQTGLIKHLSQYGYHMSLTTPCLFYHDTSAVKFLLWVDDFIIKYKRSDQASIDHLLNCLRQKYTITVDLTGSSYLGMTIERNRIEKWLKISAPGYIQQMAKELHLVKGKYVGSPIIYHSTKYSSDTQMEVIDDTPKATLKHIKFLQKLVGKLLFYTLLVDPPIAVAVNRLASAQSQATEQTMLAATRLIQYCLHHPDATITYYASDMQLVCHSDASHDSEPKSRSRIAGVWFAGSGSTNTFEGPNIPKPRFNGCIGFMSTKAPTVCAGAYESEYAGLWGNVSNLEPIRQTFEDLGHPQGPTRIIYDNTVSGDIANRSCKMKRSKMVAKQYHWIQERIAFGDYILEWRKGIYNLADFFTKAHPTKHFEAMLPYFVSYPKHNKTIK